MAKVVSDGGGGRILTGRCTSLRWLSHDWVQIPTQQRSSLHDPEPDSLLHKIVVRIKGVNYICCSEFACWKKAGL